MRDDSADRLRAADIPQLLVNVAVAARKAHEGQSASPWSQAWFGTTVASITTGRQG